MESGGFFRKFLFKMYNIGAFVVIFGLVLKYLGNVYAFHVTVAGLLCECMIFLFSAFVSEDNVPAQNKNNSEHNNNGDSKFKKIYYTDGNGYYFLDKPNAIGVAAGSPSIYGGGVVPVRPESNNIGVYSPDINTQIENLQTQLQFLIDVRDEQIKNYIAKNNVNKNESSKDSADNNDSNDGSANKKRVTRVGRRVGRIAKKEE